VSGELERAAGAVGFIRPRLAEYTGGALRNDRSSLLAAGGVEDHVHLPIRALH
jgi:hypothetical protein